MPTLIFDQIERYRERGSGREREPESERDRQTERDRRKKYFI